MARFDSVDTSPNLARIQKQFCEQVRVLFQEYLDAASMESDGFIEGLDITHTQAVEFVNDVLLYALDGKELSENQKVVSPLER